VTYKTLNISGVMANIKWGKVIKVTIESMV